MSHRVENISNHHSGDSRLLTVQVRYPSDSESSQFGDPVDVRNSDVFYYFSESESGSSCIFKKEVGDGIEIVDGLNGIVEIKWDSTDTEGLEGKEYYHECEFVDTYGDVSTVFTGTVEVIEGLNC